MAGREATVRRKTKETDISVTINIDGAGTLDGKTSIGFFDHMLDLLARHSLTDIKIEAAGDLEVDAHHTVEDVGIALGQAIDKALGDRKGIRRFGSITAPMDEALAEVAVDIGGRAYFSYNVELPSPKAKVGDFDIELVEEFFQALASNARMNLHMILKSGSNLHHIAEALFKGFAKAFDAATAPDERVGDVPSTKGAI